MTFHHFIKFKDVTNKSIALCREDGVPFRFAVAGAACSFAAEIIKKEKQASILID